MYFTYFLISWTFWTYPVKSQIYPKQINYYEPINGSPRSTMLKSVKNFPGPLKIYPDNNRDFSWSKRPRNRFLKNKPQRQRHVLYYPPPKTYHYPYADRFRNFYKNPGFHNYNFFNNYRDNNNNNEKPKKIVDESQRGSENDIEETRLNFQKPENENFFVKTENSLIDNGNSLIKNENSLINNVNSLVGSGNSLLKNGNSLIKNWDSHLKNEIPLSTSGNSLVKHGNSFIVNGNSPIKSGDSHIKNGNSHIMSGNSPFKQGNSLLNNKNPLLKNENFFNKPGISFAKNGNFFIKNGNFFFPPVPKKFMEPPGFASSDYRIYQRPEKNLKNGQNNELYKNHNFYTNHKMNDDNYVKNSDRAPYIRDHAPENINEVSTEDENSTNDEEEVEKLPKKITNFSGISPDGDRVEFQIQGHEGPRTYLFGYDTGEGSNRQYRLEEKLKDGTVKGQYGYYDARGKLRSIKYVAKPEEGYKEKHHSSPELSDNNEENDQSEI